MVLYRRHLGRMSPVQQQLPAAIGPHYKRKMQKQLEIVSAGRWGPLCSCVAFASVIKEGVRHMTQRARKC